MSDISVIITTYTGYGKFLVEAVNSVLNQTYKNFEIIIVDDASTDETPEIVKTISKKDNRMRYILNNINMGMGNSKNIGIKDSTSKYIVCLDSDDSFEPTFLEEHYNAMKNNKGDIIYSFLRYFGLANFVEYKNIQSLDQIRNFSTITHSALYRREDWELVGGYKDVTLSDWEFWINLTKIGKKPYIIPKVLFNYRKHPDAITIKGDIKKRMNTTDAIEQIIKHHPEIFISFKKGISHGFNFNMMEEYKK